MLDFLQCGAPQWCLLVINHSKYVNISIINQIVKLELCCPQLSYHKSATKIPLKPPLMLVKSPFSYGFPMDIWYLWWAPPCNAVVVYHQALLWWLSQWCRLHPESAAGPGGFNRQQLELTWGYHVYMAIYIYTYIYNGYKIGCGHEKYRRSRINNY